MALCCLLAVWTGGDGAPMDWRFQQSGLVRPEWHAIHNADGTTDEVRTVA